jgi:hypothetical protein
MFKTSNKETLLKLYRIKEVPMLQYGCENWPLIKEHKRRNDRAETKFVPSAAAHTLYSHETNGEKTEK